MYSMTKRKLFTIVIYTLVLLFLGRNLTMLPKFASFRFYTPKDITILQEDLTNFTNKQPGIYSVYYQDLSSEKPLSFGINEHRVYTAASLNKVPIAATLYSLADKGKINLNDKIIIQEDDIQDYGTGSLRYKEPGTAYSLKTLTQLMLEESDNTAAHVLGARIGMDPIQQTITAWGLTQTSMKDNTTSAKDMALLFEKIYNHEVTNPALTKELLDFLHDTQFEDRLPRNMPQTVAVHHKIGDTVGGVHDAGIIIYDGKAFFLAVLTADIGDTEDQTKQAIGTIAKKVYDFRQHE